jgi:hypothetical protein
VFVTFLSDCLCAFFSVNTFRNFVEVPKFREINFDPLHRFMPASVVVSTSCQHNKVVRVAALSDRPLIAQFAGDNAKELVAAAKFVQHEVDAVDLNLGCPQKIAKSVRNRV